MPLLRYFLLLLLVSVMLSGLRAQSDSLASPYHLSVKRELVYGIGAGGARWLGHTLRQQSAPVLLKDLRLKSIPFFDRYTPSRKHGGAAHASDFTLDAASVLPLVLLAGRRSRREAGKIGLLLLETMVLNQGLTDIVKATAHRARPYLHDSSLSPDLVVNGKDRIAFVSGHTSVAAASCFFFGRVFADYYPASRLKPYVWGVAATLPAVTAYLRLHAGQHYPSDVIGGYLLGAVIGYGVPALHRKPIGGKKWTVAQQGTGLRLVYRFD